MEGYYCYSNSSSKELIERAKEELQMLETHQPNRFEYLKVELKSFIFFLQEESIAPASSSLVATQVSSTNNKKRKSREGSYEKKASLEEMSSSSSSSKSKKGTRRKDRVDIVLERAQLCLQKIRDVKSALC